MTRSYTVWVRWLAIYAATTLLVAWLSSVTRLRVSVGMLVYMLLIAGASREGSRSLSMVMVGLSYLAVDFFFVAPRNAIGRTHVTNLVVLLGFVVTAGVIAQLILSLRQTATLATERAAAIERLGAERLQLERERARAEMLQEAERLRQALIASLSHDLRSPVMALTMLADPQSGLEPADAMARIAEQARNLGDFLATLGRFTIASGGGDLLRIESQVVDDLVGAAVRSSAAALAHHVVTVSAPSIDSVLMVRCDFTLSLQILANLLQNAARYSPPDSSIVISSAVDGDAIRITVSDRGVGVSAADIDRIFRPMQRGSRTEHSTAGTGMGLGIARTFAQAQGGDVAYRPRDKGGSHFDLLLPSVALTSPMPIASLRTVPALG